MNKTISFLTMLLLCSLAAFAQFPDSASKSFTFGFTFSNFGVNPGASRTGTILYKYYKTPSFAYRFSTSISLSNYSTTTDNGGKKTINTNYSSAFGVGFGAQKNLATIEKFAIYTGLDLAYSYSSYKYTSRTETYDVSQPGTSGKNGDFNETINYSTVPATIALYPFIGLNYFLTKHFSIGAEFSMSCSYGFPGTGYRITNQRYNGMDLPQQKNNTSPGGSISINPNAGSLITVSVYF